MNHKQGTLISGEFKVGELVMKYHILANGVKVIEYDSVKNFLQQEAKSPAAWVSKPDFKPVTLDVAEKTKPSFFRRIFRRLGA